MKILNLLLLFVLYSCVYEESVSLTGTEEVENEERNRFMEGKYLNSTDIFRRLAPAAWLFMVSTGPMILFHRWEQTRTIALIESSGAVALIVGNLILLPTHGVDGAVLSMINDHCSSCNGGNYGDSSCTTLL